jgi:hypothetical protein
MMRIDPMMRLAVACLAVAALAGAPASARKGGDSSKSRSFLEDNGGSGAQGECRVRFGSGRSQFEVRVRDLAPESEHQLRVDDLPWASFRSDRKGKARLRFSSQAKGRKVLPLPGDPRGARIAIDDDGGEVLSGICSGEGEASGSLAKLRSRLAPTDLAPAGAEANADFEIRKNGRARFEVELERVPPGDYGVFVDGTERGTISVGALGRGQMEWESDDSGGNLDFDPRGKLIDVAGPDGVWFSGGLEGSIPGVNQCAFSETETPLVAAPAAGSGSGGTRLRVREDCRRDFSLEIEDVPLGAYDLLIGGVPKGTIQVVNVGGQNKGEIEFTSEPDDSGELFLDFDPVGAEVEVRQADNLFFSLTQGPPGSGGGGGSASCSGAPTEIAAPLLNSGAVPAASGDARYRLRADCRADFSVEIEDVADGNYEFRVGGTTVGTIAVSGGRGELEFSDPVEPGKGPLGFDPRGQTVEVFHGATLLLQRSFPS